MTELHCTELAARICQLVLELNRLLEEAAKDGLVVHVEIQQGSIAQEVESARNVATLRVSLAQPSVSIAAPPSIGEDCAP
jgi:uncharacterized protein YqiB (DUF1249 family)